MELKEKILLPIRCFIHDYILAKYDFGKFQNLVSKKESVGHNFSQYLDLVELTSLLPKILGCWDF